MTTQEEAIQAVYKYAADLFKTGLSAPQVESKLMEKGLDREAAAIIVNKLSALQPAGSSDNEAAKKDMIFGALWFIGGILITGWTYLAASGGGSYVITWGAIVFGAIQFFRGVSRLKRS